MPEQPHAVVDKPGLERPHASPQKACTQYLVALLAGERVFTAKRIAWRVDGIVDQVAQTLALIADLVDKRIDCHASGAEVRGEAAQELEEKNALVSLHGHFRVAGDLVEPVAYRGDGKRQRVCCNAVYLHFFLPLPSCRA